MSSNKRKVLTYTIQVVMGGSEELEPGFAKALEKKLNDEAYDAAVRTKAGVHSTSALLVEVKEED